MQNDLYQRELRLQEDEIYRLEDYIEEYQGIISGYRCKVADLERDLTAAQAARRAVPTPAPPRGGSAIDPVETGPSLLESPEPTDLAPPSGELPEIEEVAPPFKPGATGEDPESLEPAPLFQQSAIQRPREVVLAEPPREPAPLTQATALASAQELAEPLRFQPPPNPYPTAADSSPREQEPTPDAVGDQTLLVRVEPSPDQATTSVVAVVTEASPGSLGRFDGEASVMLTDPRVDGGMRRIARWDFTADEVRESWAPNDAAGGRVLALPVALPDNTPTNAPLRLWVRLVERDGRRRLQAAELAFVGEPMRLATPDRFARVDRPRRLPQVDDRQAEPLEPLAATANEESQWRPAGRVERRNDTAVVPAAYNDAW